MKNRVFVVWTIVIVIILASICVIGFKLKAQNTPYQSLEKELIESAKVYLGANVGEYPSKGNILTLKSEKLVNAGIDVNLKVDDEECAGYIEISNKTMGYEYNAYIKCENYKTKGFSDK